MKSMARLEWQLIAGSILSCRGSEIKDVLIKSHIALQSPAPWLFMQEVVRANTKDTSNSMLLYGIPVTKGLWCGTSFPLTIAQTVVVWLNSLRSSDANMRRYLANIVSSEPMLEYCSLNPWEQTSVKFWSKFIIYLQENALETVGCKMADILLRPQC